MSDSEGEERSTFAVPKFKGKYVEFEPQLLAFVMLKGCAIAFEPNQTSDYFPSGQRVFSEDEVKRTKQKSFVKKNLQGIVALNSTFAKYPKHLGTIRHSSWFVLETLRKKCLPKDGLTHFDAVKALSEVTMDPNEAPMDYLERLLMVQYQFEDDIHERQLLKQFLSGCNAKYKPSILQIYRTNLKVSTSDLAEKLQIDFHLSEALDSSLLIEQDTIELAQVGSARPPPRNFPPRLISTVDPSDKTCFLCGNKGHLIYQCPLKGSGQAPVVPKCVLQPLWSPNRVLLGKGRKRSPPPNWMDLTPTSKSSGRCCPCIF